MSRPAILTLNTAVPRHRLEQAAAARWMSEALGARVPAGWLARLYARSGIERRYTVLPDYLAPPRESLLLPAAAEAPGASGRPLSTTARMAIYRREAPLLAAAAARGALADGITHLIAVSCTGLYAPGLDLDLVRILGLDQTVRRSVLGFMGCAAGLTALRTAAEIVRGEPRARVLVVAVELCSLHLQPGADREALVAASLFGDGAAACLVGRPSQELPGLFGLDAFSTVTLEETGSEMVWSIGDHGFTLALSPRIPARLSRAAPALVRSAMEGLAPSFWAVHPGGRAILDGIERAFTLAPDCLAPSRTVLARYGNLSSPSLFFVLDEIRRRRTGECAGEGEPGVALAFGPGLTAELGRLSRLPAAERRLRRCGG